MNLEKIEIRKKKYLKAPDFATLKHLIFIIMWNTSSPNSSKAKLLTIPCMRRCFEDNGGAKGFDLKQKKINLKKKNSGSSRFEGFGPVEIFFFAPVANKTYVRYSRQLFVR